MAKFFCCFFLVVVQAGAYAQKIHGTIYNDKGDLLPFASVTIKGTTIGASANNSGRYSFPVINGKYILVCQHIGYVTQEKEVTVNGSDEAVSFILPDQKLLLKEVVVNSSGEDPAYAIIRSAIKMRPSYNAELNAFTCDLYTKDLIKLRKLPKKIFGQEVPNDDRKDMGLDTNGAGIIYLSESIASVAAQKPGKFKLQVKSSRVSGSDGFGFSIPTFISFYQNNVTIFTQKLNPRGFISPIADGALNYYRYKYLGSFWENGKEINTIRVAPRRSYEPLFSGIINISENDWRIFSLDLTLTKTSQLEILDTLQITQLHLPADKNTWRVKNQLIHFAFNQFGVDAVGNFVNVYSNYNLSPVFAKGFFDNVIIKYDTGVNKKPKAYWDTIRPVPLEQEERKDYAVKDSIMQVNKDSARSRRTVDSLNAKRSKIRLMDVFWRGIERTRYTINGFSTWGLNGLIKGLEYNLAEGLVVNAVGNYQRQLKSIHKDLSVEPSLRYGFSNTHLNGAVRVQLSSRNHEANGKLDREQWTMAGGRRVTQFNNSSPIEPLVNTISTLFYGDNFMKTYENVFGELGYSKRYENGFQISIKGVYENRRPLENTTKWTLFAKDSFGITPNYPVDRIRQQFTPHQAVIASIDLRFRPGQRYIQFPESKIPIGSKYPTFAFNYTKGFNGVFGSDVNFDKWRFSVNDDVNFKIGGLLKYKVGVGGFINAKSVFIQDYQHFNGNLTAVASEYVNSFQLVSYYAGSTTANFYTVAHLEHHFNGMLTNKIPGFQRLNWFLVAGTNTFYVDKNNYHVEVFAGIENIFKLLRIDLVSGYDNGGYNRTAFRLGFGGLLGGSISTSGKGATISFGF